MATRKNTVARFKVGELTYCRYVKGGDTYATVEGYEFDDSEYTWKVKVDKKTNKRYYVSMGGYGKRWLLPERYPPGGSNQQAEKTSSVGFNNIAPTSPLSPMTFDKEGEDDGTIMSLIDLYKQRLAFNPGEQTVDLPPELIDSIAAHLSTVVGEVRLPSESILSVILSAGYYLKKRIRQGSSIHNLIDSTVQKLAYAVAADVKANVASSPFVECYTKITYLTSINESIASVVDEQTADIEIIKRNIELRKVERKRAATKLLTWKNRCVDVDKEVVEAATKGSTISNNVAAYLSSIRSVNDVVMNKFPTDAQTCTAQIERLNAQLQDGCQQSKALQSSYKKLRQSRDSLRSSLDTMSTEHCDCDCADRCDDEGSFTTLSRPNSDVLLLEQVAMQREENERLKARLAAAEQLIHENEFQKRAENKARDQEMEALRSNLLKAKGKVKSVQTDLDGDAFEGTVISEGDRKSILDIIQRQKQLVETLSLTQDDESPDSDPSQSEMLQKCLTAAHTKIKSQREQIRELKSLLSVTLDLKESADDPVRALINATSPLHMRFEQDSSDPVLLDISPIGSQNP